ncbi:hypothetical protein RhiirC2_794858 [Rhizophagus irregularis]|uniref:Uncharacterized protein n=1 Tax=Rhizophagus irregularis TaxID=588596 RepID=A0A2N1MCU3_9GLOM|nr:hypothetical protein RhiirC2_794858 [Rhizophagus irregularis]
MGNNKIKKKTSVNKQSSYILTQEFVDKFTDAFIHILRNMLVAVELHPKNYTEKFIKLLIPGGDLVKHLSHSDIFQQGPITSERHIYANPVIDESMNIDESADLSITVSQPNQEGNLKSTQSTSSSSTPTGTFPSNVIIQSEEQNKKSKITRLTLIS